MTDSATSSSTETRTAAFRLVGIALMSDLEEGDHKRAENWRASHHAWREKLLAGLAGAFPEGVFELRYLAVPKESGKSDIDLVLLLHADRAHGVSNEVCAIEALLRMNPSYVFERLSERQELQSVLQPFSPAAAVEVRRGTESLALTPEFAPIGFLQGRGRDTRRCHVDLPVNVEDGSARSTLLALCDLLSEQTVPTLVAIQVGRRLTEASRTAGRLGRALRGHELDVLHSHDVDLDAAVDRLCDLRRRTLSEVRIAIVSAGVISNALIEIVASELVSADPDRRASAVLPAHLAHDLLAPGPMRFPSCANDELACAFTPPEIARVFALPTAGERFPGLPTVRPNLVRVPDGLARHGRHLGDKRLHRGHLRINTGRTGSSPHFYVLGQSGVGKSTLLATMALSDIRAGEGVGVIDPHGDLIEFVLARVPEERRDDVVLIDPGDCDHPVGLNLLDIGDEDARDFICGEFMKMMQKLWDPRMQEPMAFGPMYSQAMRAAIMTVMSFREGGTVVDIPRLFEDRAYLSARLRDIPDFALRHYWDQTWEDSDKKELRPYITSKVDIFRQNRTLRRILGQLRSTVDIRGAMDRGRIVLLNLSTGRLGAHDSAFLGSVLTTRILAAAMSRAAAPVDARRRFTLYIDEFHSFTTDSIASMVSQARKYGLHLVLAHQNVHQLSEPIRHEVLGNVGNLIAFRPGPLDVDMIQRYFAPAFSSRDLLTLPNWTAAARLVGGAGPLAPFTFHTVVDPEPACEIRRERIRALCRERYGRPRSVVEAEIDRRLTARWRDGHFETNETGDSIREIQAH